MAARYVNPDNIAAQGQYFYTGLLPGSYDTGGAGGGNVYGAGSGGSAGVGADRTGSDSSKSWAYQSNWNMNLGKTNWKNPNKRKPTEDGPGPSDPPDTGLGDPPGGGEAPPRGKRTPVGNGGPVDTQHFPVVSGRERWGADGKMVRLGPNEVDPMGPVDPSGPFGKQPKMLGPGPKQPREPSQTPGAIRKRAGRAKARDEKEAHADFVGAVNPATGGPRRTPHLNVSGPISNLPKLGTELPTSSAAASRSQSRPPTFPI